MSEAKITMKILIDRNKNKVLFAEAGKECVDFLLHILSLPLGTVVEYLSKTSMVGSLGNLYGSFETLSTDYVQEGLNKDCLLRPKPATSSASNVPLLTANPTSDILSTKTFYTCRNVDGYNHSRLYFSDDQGVKCPHCQRQLDRALTYMARPDVKPKGLGVNGYVKGVVTYMIMDDLSVQPMSTISSITLLNKFNVQDVASLEEQEISLDTKLALALMKASLMSQTVLSDVLLGETATGFM